MINLKFTVKEAPGWGAYLFLLHFILHFILQAYMHNIKYFTNSFFSS